MLQHYEIISLRQWLSALALVTVVVIISFYWLDRPLALLMQNQLSHSTRRVAGPLTYIDNPLVWIAVITFVVLGIIGLTGRPLSKLRSVILFCSLSLIVVETIKNQIKFVFGRTWPETWYKNNPSFIQDGVYGFNWFHAGQAYQSFPSGHMAATCAIVAVIWVYYPRLRFIYSAIVLAVLIGLLGTNFHFLSDCIAGAFLGTSVGLMTSKLLGSLQQLRQG